MSPWVEVPFRAQAEHSGLRVDAFLAARLRRYSRAEVQRLIRGGRVFLRGRAAKPSARVAKDETVVVRYPRRPEPDPEHASLAVVFEDRDLLAVCKPGGVLSHPTDRVVRNTVIAILAAQFPGLRPHLVHRLDRETSGVLLLAKNPAAARSLVDQFTRRRVEKEYLAVVFGRFPHALTTVDLPIGREDGDIKVRQAAGRGREAATEFTRLDACERASLLLAKPRTGRLHQIRVHLAALGHPIVGDKLYSGEGAAYLKAVRGELTAEDIDGLGAPRQLLHAFRVRFAHPLSGAPVELRAPLPEDFLARLRTFGLQAPSNIL
ncbi:MAG: RluA family pseudouridine synthase [Elusimicrobia bacterium]|nr:RluA family pseudouridine synthase [Elusimicrobiota bacterium]